ncbi:MAG: DNA-binding response regulator [Bacteroidetes bacterium]|nr:MAG: DNA-binding response regulator [Bacteroidota bacterium]
MKKLNVLIVEDEIIIAETIKYYLEERDHNVLNIAISYEEAVQAYRLRCPDLVLLDIRLYEHKSGIDFANFLMTQAETPPYIYLTSQYDQRILAEALKTNPSGYLTKPIQKETLWTTVDAAYQLHTSTKLIHKIIKIYDGKTNHQIKISDILYIQADHIYSKIILTNYVEIISRNTLQWLLEELNSNTMIWCHRSYIVNRSYIERWNSEEILLKDNMIIPISRSRKNEVITALKR